jgi:hypothetical protein
MKAITEYWGEHYINDIHCSLCGNSGIIDTTGVTTIDNRIAQGARVMVGRKNFCICPNGQAMRKKSDKEPK